MAFSLALVQVKVYEMISPFCVASSGGLHVKLKLVISTVTEKLAGIPLGATWKENMWNFATDLTLC